MDWMFSPVTDGFKCICNQTRASGITDFECFEPQHFCYLSPQLSLSFQWLHLQTSGAFLWRNILQSISVPRGAAFCLCVVSVCWKHSATETWKRSSRRHFSQIMLNRQFTENLQLTLWLNAMMMFFFNVQHFLCEWHIFINVTVHRWRWGYLLTCIQEFPVIYQDTQNWLTFVSRVCASHSAHFLRL